MPAPESPTEAELVTAPIKGDNLAGMNLGGTNLAGKNLGGMNLGGMNLGGTNLGGMNLGGMNLGGTNLGGNNLGGMNLGGTNLGGMNLGGMNLGGMNLGGMNLGASNLGGSNIPGTNGGMNLGGINPAARSLAGGATGYNLHDVPVPDGLLYSGEDVWLPKSGQCIVLGIGSTAFARLLGQQTPNARLSVALGKLPWGMSTTVGGPIALDAWEAIVWGDQSYCTFVLAAPPGSTWAGVAGFIKAVFRWNAPPTQSVDISGIEASAAVDPTLSSQIFTYTGMMDAAAKVRNGVIAEKAFVAGELAFVTANTNNESVQVDFSAWVRGVAGSGLVLANVDSTNPPTFAEGVYSAFENADGSVGISVSKVNVGGSLISAYGEMDQAYAAYQAGTGPRPLPTRCGGALYLNLLFQDSIPEGKCDSGVSWTDSPAGYPTGHRAWSQLPGTTAPMNAYMYLPNDSNPFLRAAGRPILSETYIFLWEPNHTLPVSPVGGWTGQDRTGLGIASSSSGACTAADDPNHAFNNATTARWCANGTPTVSSPRSIMYMWGANVPVTSYRITSASDFPVRDPKDWTFQGCAGTCTVGADAGWVTLDTRTNQTFTNRLETLAYSFSNTTAYSQYRLRITANKGSVGNVHVREIQVFDSGGAVTPLPGTDRTENGVVSWTGKVCSSLEMPSRAFDNLMTSAGASRWCALAVPSATSPVSLAYGWTGSAHVVTSYRLTSASDQNKRDPKTWSLQGCNGTCRVGSDAGWVTLDSRSNEIFASRYQTKIYSFSNATAYAQYRLRITANNGDSARLQVGELQLY